MMSKVLKPRSSGNPGSAKDDPLQIHPTKSGTEAADKGGNKGATPERNVKGGEDA